MIQIYTGEGKGKTTAALGQGLRGVGSGLKVIMIQLLKGGPTGELEALKAIDGFEIYRFEKERDFVWNLKDKEIQELKKEIRAGYNFAFECVKNKKCNMLIIDEIMGAVTNKFISEDEVVDLLNANDCDIEIILTGRYAPEKIIEKADLVTEMKPIKHYFDKGVEARKGIEF